MPYLLVIEDDRSSVFPLPAKPPEIVIGRSLDADLPLRQTSVSRHHARLLYQGDLLQICDLGSHNGSACEWRANHQQAGGVSW